MAEQLQTNNIQRLKQLMAQLRHPQDGCPWDIEQDFASIASHTVEEAYEVANAIANHDMVNLKEELGDLLFQVIFHSRIAQERGHFSFDDVVDGIVEKMISRHPHVFGNAKIETAKEQEEAWELLKQQEKAKKGQQEERILADVPVGLPPLVRAYKLQKKASKHGFDWSHIESVWKKVEEELHEVKEAIAGDDKIRIEEELGDLLFAVVNLVRKSDMQPDDVLRKANNKFEKRFNYVEEQLKMQGRIPSNSTLEEMDALWERSKKGGL